MSIGQSNRAKNLVEGIVVALVLVVMLVVMMPKFLDAQVHHKVVLALRNLEETKIAINAYTQDSPLNDYFEMSPSNSVYFAFLTTPVSYITDRTALIDPFNQSVSSPKHAFLSFIPILDIKQINVDAHQSFLEPKYLLFSIGPSQISENVMIYGYDRIIASNVFGPFYSPSNGIKSIGFIYATAQGVVNVE